MKLFAHVFDPNGLTDGLDGYVAELVAAEDETALAAQVGSDLAPFFIEAPNAQCIGWRYRDGVFGAPEEG